MFDVWHLRLGHPSFDRLRTIQQIDKSVTCNKIDYFVYPLAKQKRNRFSLHVRNTVCPFELIHMDVWGPFATPTLDGHRYFLTIVDDFSRVTWVYLLRSKSDVSTIVPSFYRMVLAQFNQKIKVRRTDNGSEFFLTKFYDDHGIYINAVVLKHHNKMGL